MHHETVGTAQRELCRDRASELRRDRASELRRDRERLSYPSRSEHKSRGELLIGPVKIKIIRTKKARAKAKRKKK